MPVRLNITMDEELYNRLKDELPAKRISAFINEAVRAYLFPKKETLDTAYQAASQEVWRSDLTEDWDPLDTEGWPTE